MAWSTPKTDWEPTDTWSYSAYNRIVNNVEYLKDTINTMFSGITTEETALCNDYYSVAFAEEINKIENNLKAINEKSYKLDIGTTKTYQSNTKTIDYAEVNRLETACLLLYNTVTAHKANIPHLEIILGGDKTFRVGRSVE